MRLDALELLAYGPFSGVTLDFSRGHHGLHVIYGANEAGKSSALRALEAGLFGIGERTQDGFVHDYKALRLGMTLRSAAGAELTFVRRKGRKQPLRDRQDVEPLPDDALRPFLAGVSEQEFTRVFGLGHARLRAGSQHLLDGAEGVETALVGAALGVGKLRAVRDALAKEAAELFKAGGSKPRINAAVTRHKQHQAELNKSAVAVTAWSAARRKAKDAIQAREAADTTENLLRAEQRALELVSRNRPRIARLSALRAELAGYADLAHLPSDFGSRLDAARRAHADAERALGLRQLEQRRRSEELGASTSDLVLLDRREEIKRLEKLAAEVQKALGDRERLRAKAELFAQAREARLRELGLDAALDAGLDGIRVEDLRVALGGATSCRKLIARRGSLTAARRTDEQRRATLERERRELAAKLETAPAMPEPAALERAVKVALGCGNIDARLADHRRARDDLDRELEARTRLLEGFSGSPEALQALPLPGQQTLDDFTRRFQQLEDDERQGRLARAQLGAKRRGLEGELEQLSARGAVPSEEDLLQARARRDGLWRLVRRAWLEHEQVEDATRVIDPERPLPEAMSRAIERGDELVDRLRRESERAAQLEERRRQLQALARDTAAADAEERATTARRAHLEQEWAAAWSRSGLAVGTVSAMKDALALREALLAKVRERTRTGAALEDLVTQRQSAATALLRELAASGAPRDDLAPEAPFPRLLEAAEARLRALGADASARRRDLEALQRLDGELKALDAALATREAELGAWQVEYDAATRRLPLRPNDPAESVPELLDRVADFIKAHDELESLVERIAKIDADEAQLADRLERFRQAYLPELAEQQPALFVERLGDLLEQQQREHQQREAARKEVSLAEKACQQAEVELRRATSALEALAREAHAESVDGLAAIAQRATEKAEHRKSLQELEALLREEGLSIDELERRVASFAPRDVAAELESIEARVPAAREAAKAARDAAATASAALDAMERETGADERAAEMASIAAEVREDAERYVRLVLASRLLGAAVERFRSRNETPLLRLASVHFATLTRGRYTRVETDVSDSGKPFFVVREAQGGKLKILEELSSGTADQLHLALVLGALEHRFAAGAEPMPLVLDDVLVHFDDERSLAALEGLARFSTATQVLLFTHHAKLREQAESLAGSYDIHVYELRG